jgi:hypothetical protein
MVSEWDSTKSILKMIFSFLILHMDCTTKHDYMSVIYDDIILCIVYYLDDLSLLNLQLGVFRPILKYELSERFRKHHTLKIINDDYYPRTEYYFKGELHRDNGPATEYADGDKEWYRNGRRHRDDGPAIECANGYKSWYQNGILQNRH